MPKLMSSVATSLGIALLTSLVSACHHAEASAPLAAAIDDRVDGFWWSHVGEQSTAVANFGPWLETSSGRLRRWSLVIHAPGAEFGLVCDQGLVWPEDMAPIHVTSSQFEVDLRPVAGTTWGEVESDAQLEALVEGLF